METYACGVCHDSGWLRKLVGLEPWRTELMRCGCQRAADEKRHAERARAISDLDKLHAGCTFATYERGQDSAAADAAEAWSRMSGAGSARNAACSEKEGGQFPWLVLWGRTGTGKTHLLAAAFNALLAAGCGQADRKGAV